jgi:hypothetical protein
MLALLLARSGLSASQVVLWRLAGEAAGTTAAGNGAGVGSGSGSGSGGGGGDARSCAHCPWAQGPGPSTSGRSAAPLDLGGAPGLARWMSSNARHRSQPAARRALKERPPPSGGPSPATGHTPFNDAAARRAKGDAVVARTRVVLAALRSSDEPLTRAQLTERMAAQHPSAGVASHSQLKQLLAFLKKNGWARPRPGAGRGSSWAWTVTPAGQAVPLEGDDVCRRLRVAYEVADDLRVAAWVEARAKQTRRLRGRVARAPRLAAMAQRAAQRAAGAAGEAARG